MSGPAVGSEARPLRVAVVGSGPSGFYAAESLLKRPGLAARVDMLDRLPTPFGLVRGGVAPDHQKIKAVTAVYERVADSPSFRFFGNVRLGADVGLAELREAYDAVLLAVGNESDRSMGIPGEDLEGSRPATEFVGWYNGHPDHRRRRFDLSVERAAVVGVGNVAMDVTRLLARDPEELAGTDIAGYALEALRRSKVREVVVLGRRGAAQAAFSPKEIKELAELAGADLVVRPEEVRLDEASKASLSDPDARRNVEFLQAQAARGEGSRPRKIRLRFLVSPVEVLGQGGKAAGLRIELNELAADEGGVPRPRGTGRFETFPVGLVLRSVGYFGVPVPGVPFDERKGVVPNAAGRVLEKAGGAALPGVYVVGWAKRGPSGLIGTNRPDSVATVDALVEDLRGRTGPARDPERLPGLLRAKGARWVDLAGWRVLDALERENGRKAGKIREKFTTVEEMLGALDGAGRAA